MEGLHERLSIEGRAKRIVNFYLMLSSKILS